MKILFEENETATAQRVKELVSAISPEIEVVKMPGALPVTPPVQRYLVRKGTRLFSVSVDDIAYFYIKGRLSCIKTVCNTDHFIAKSLDEIELEIDRTGFFRINRQFIVNYRSIQQVHAWFNGKLKVWVRPDIPEDIIVSRLKAAEFRKWLGE